MPLIDVPTIHAVTDPRILIDSGFLTRAEGVFRALGSAGAVHLRAHGFAASGLYRLASRLRSLQDETGCRLVINDRIDVAAAAGAWGSQLGLRSIEISEAIKAAPSLRFGVSVHSKQQAEAVLDQRPDWLMAGHIFETPSHTDTAPSGIALVTELAPMGVPVIAIGGILPEHVPSLLAAGARGVAVVRGIWGAPDPEAAARSYLQVS